MTHPLRTFVNFVVALFFVMLGLVCLSLPWSSRVKNALITFISESSLMLGIIGFLLLLTGLAIIFYLIFSRSQRTYHVRKENYKFDIDKNVIDTYVKIYFEERFPNEEVSHQISIKKNRLMLAADLPFLPKPEQKPFTEQIYEELSELLTEKIGTDKELYLSISFPEKGSDV